MSMVNSGDITEISWSNPDLGSGFLFPIAGADSTYNLGGFRGNDQAVLDGAGRMLNQKNRMPWMFQVEIGNDMNNTLELETVSAIAASLSETTWTFQNINGAVYQGVGAILGDIELNGNKSSFTLKVQGGGILQQL